MERRADIFFALYLPHVLGQVVNASIDQRMVPEFPLKQNATKSSDKADYLALTTDRTRGFLIELKTDNASINAEQYAYLLEARRKGLVAKLEELRAIVIGHKNKSVRKKYFCLFEELAELGLLKLPDGLAERVYAGNSKGVFELFAKIEILEHAPPVDIVYVVPHVSHVSLVDSSQVTLISFEQFAECIEGLDDHLARLFAAMLRRWALSKAGEPQRP